MKQCRICHKWKNESGFYFRRDSDKYCSECKDCRKKYRKEYYKKQNRIYAKKYRETHKEQKRKYDKQYKLLHKKESKEYYQTHKKQRNEWRKNQRAKNPKYKLNCSISTLINRSLKNGKNGCHWETVVDFTRNNLVEHLEKQFLTGMTWDNYGEWHVDHEIPISVFNFDKHTDLDFKRCWALSNLRPMWATENMKKHNKIDKPFQASLKL